jgi:hypothetical protein
MPRRLVTVTGACVLALSGTLALADGSSVGAKEDEWTKLRRPLHLPRVARSAVCPKTHGRPAHQLSSQFGTAHAAGNGPVYPLFDVDLPYDPNARSGAVHYGHGSFLGRGWRAVKVLWIVAPSYRGPVLIRGRRLDDTLRLMFEITEHAPLVSELHLSGKGPRGWRNWPSTLAVRARGCYGFQIDGRRFSRLVVFRAVP